MGHIPIGGGIIGFMPMGPIIGFIPICGCIMGFIPIWGPIMGFIPIGEPIMGLGLLWPNMRLIILGCWGAIGPIGDVAGLGFDPNMRLIRLGGFGATAGGIPLVPAAPWHCMLM